MPLNQVNDKFWVGDGPPTTGDSICSYLPGFPIQSVYIDSETGIVYVRNAINGVSSDWVSLTATATPSYKVYTAILTQTGTDAPVATVLENTLGGTVVWSYESSGIYLGTLANAFPQNKTFVIIGTLNDNTSFSGSGFNIAYRKSTSEIGINTQNNNGEGIDEQLGETAIEIRVYT